MTRSSTKRPTVRDVARVAGVSTATVSRALQSPDIVSKKTRDAVFAAVSETGYSVNTAAQMLRRNRSGTVLVILPDISNPFFSKILSGIEEVATRASLTILIGNTNGDDARYANILENLRNGRADGALILNGTAPPDGMLPEGTPIVSISERPEGAGYAHVGTDNQKAAFDATQYLLAQGHQRIAHVTGPEGNALTKDRRAGYIEAMTEAGLTDQICTIPGGFTYGDGERAADHLFAQHPDTTAAFCANDESAMGVIRGLQRQGYSVPGEISVMGFDDVPFSRIFQPELTTVHQARNLIGQRAMEILLDLLEDNTAPAELMYLGHTIVTRNSVARPRS
ncbi:LacI family DNA-binding transcriptional regulator [Ruegeria sp. THAF57]|uniref:LacI family DNA-binding transcriptional regulator n=1 Tax=Ruegeria sp. THAF57 TaxID=2744555 RepID=UPI0015DDE0F1|nr:LacI family DNA-binding transcriptional regulator [Ruegeria sp. THAF57]